MKTESHAKSRNSPVRHAGEPTRIEPLFPGSRLLRSVHMHAESVVRERDRILAEARAEAERVKEEASKRAEDAVQQAARRAADSAAEKIDLAVSALAKAVDGIEGSAAAEVDRLAIKIARSLLGVEIRTSPGVIKHFVVETIRASGATCRARISLHPDTAHHFIDNERFRGSDRIEVVPDESVAVGEVRVVTDLGDVCDSIESRLSDLERRLGELLDGHGGDR